MVDFLANGRLNHQTNIEKISFVIQQIHGTEIPEHDIMTELAVTEK
jgi:hypothetical protein